ncbi:tyrosine-type recombinase/integrase [Gayadomonas joobiniege]|uniref:tyrosine-type recombinase/integrase n=1 Tax=Gayadomonas joobiniege TaxID=1234606 RepID=UPI000374758E|nr:site-specific integrase [Gayadomonas joobiniege]
MPLTDAWLKSVTNKNHPKRIIKSDRDSMSARVSKNGVVTFQLRFRIANPARARGYEEVWYDIGNYPELTLKQARGMVSEVKAWVKKGIDPRKKRLGDKLSNQNQLTVSEVCILWYEKSAKQTKKRHTQVIRRFENWIFPKLGKLYWDDINLNTWLDLLEGIKNKREATSATIATELRQCATWCERRELIKTNVLVNVTPAFIGAKKVKRDRTLSKTDIYYALLASEESNMATKNKLFFYLCLFFGCRASELRLAERNHFDFDSMTWTVPPELNKISRSTNPQPIIRPLIKEIVPYIQAAFNISDSKRWMFTKDRNKGPNPEPCAENFQISLPYGIVQYCLRRYKYTLEHFTIHDLRRTARSNWSEFVQLPAAEKMLGHKFGGVMEVYDRYNYMNEMREAYTKWFYKLEEIKLGADNVTFLVQQNG